MRQGMFVFIVVLAFLSLTCAQSTTPQTTPAGSQAQSGAGQTLSTTPAIHPGMTGQMGEQRQMHAQEMQAMKQDLEKMRSLLRQIQSSESGMSAADRQAMNYNAQLWQMMINHMQQMVDHMEHMQGMGGMGMQGGMTGHHAMPMDRGNRPAKAPPTSPKPNNPTTPQ